MKRIKLLFVLFIIPTLLVIFWFKDKNILGTGESGLPFYDFNIQHNINQDAWAYYALGHPINIGAAASPTYWFLAQLQNLGIPTFILQAVYLWLIFIISGLAVYKLVRLIFPQISGFHALLSVFFYWFNPFSLVNIWNRFLNNFFIFYALLPLVVYLFIKGLKTQKFYFAILIALVSAVFSYALTSMVFILLLWGILFYLGVFHFLTSKLNRNFIIKFFLLTGVFWILTNFWWISQVFSYLELGSFDAVTSTSFKTDTNYNTFFLISERLGNLVDIFRLKHASFFNNPQLDWIKPYTFPIIIILEFLVASLFLLPLIIRKKNVYVLMFGGLLLISIFFTKGSNPPLGEIFDRAFLFFSFLQLFRNPFEKIGFILSFSTSILFAIGYWYLEGFVKNKWKVILRSLIFIWFIVIWGFPFWTGYVFTSNEPPTNEINVNYKVKVPNAYKEISNLISSQNGNFRLAVLPIGGEGITYNWEKGYSGVELSNQVLPKTAISFNTNIPFYDDISKDFERFILTKENITRILDVLNIKYILVRKDIDWKIRRMRDPQNISKRLEKIASMSSLKKVKEIDDLTLWEYTNWQDSSLYLTENLVESKPTAIEDLLKSNESSKKDTDQFVTLSSGNALIDENMESLEIIHPNFKFDLREKNVESSILLREDIIFPATRILPTSPFYPLVLFKERVEYASIADLNYKQIKKISLLGKRLVEAEQELASNRLDGAIKALDGYSMQLQELYSYPLENNSNKADAFFIQEDLYKLFSRHSQALSSLVENMANDKKEKVRSLQKTLKHFITIKGIEPIFGYKENSEYPLKNRIIYQFTVNQEGSYELLFDIRNWDNYFKTSYKELFLFQVDNELVLRRGSLGKNGLISFGFFKLTPGNHEIGWNATEANNLIDAPAEFLMDTDHGVVEKSFPIINFDTYSTYVLDMHYLIKKGSGVLVSFEGNNDNLKANKVERQFRKNLSPDHYNYDLREYAAYFTPSKSTDVVKMFFTVFPWNNCEDIYRTRNKERCKNEEFRKPYDKNTQVIVSNVSLVKVLTEVPFLKLNKEKSGEGEVPQLSFNKVNNSLYEVKIKNAKEKFALILSELYDPAWKIIDQSGVDIGKSHFLANGYANGWILDKTGNYTIKVKFTPQDLLEKSRSVSLISLISGLIFVSFAVFRRSKK